MPRSEELPPSIEAIPDAMLRYRAAEAWRAVTEILATIKEWTRWLNDLPTKKCRPAEAVSLRDRVGRAANRLLASGAVDPEFSPANVVEMFPASPTLNVFGYCLPNALREKRQKLAMIEKAPRLDALRIALESGPLALFQSPTASRPDAIAGVATATRRTIVLTAVDVARHVAVSANTMRRWIKERSVEAESVGGNKYRFNLDELDALKANQAAKKAKR